MYQKLNQLEPSQLDLQDYFKLSVEDLATELNKKGIDCLFSSNYARVGNWIVFANEEIDVDWDYYSKAWHRAHGPKRTVESRTVYFRSLTSKKVRKAELEGWRGNWQYNALIAAGICKAKTGQKHIRLHEACDIKLLSTKRGYKFYERTLKGDHLDYCVVSPLGLTYHGMSYADCLKGLRIKRQKRERQKVATISFQFVQRLGFCKDGIQEFCKTTGLDIRSRYTPQEVYEAVKTHWSEVDHFQKELKILADAIGFEVPEFN